MTDETLGDGFTMSPPTNAKDRVFAAVTRRANTLFQEMIAASATEQGTATIEAWL